MRAGAPLCFASLADLGEQPVSAVQQKLLASAVGGESAPGDACRKSLRLRTVATKLWYILDGLVSTSRYGLLRFSTTRLGTNDIAAIRISTVSTSSASAGPAAAALSGSSAESAASALRRASGASGAGGAGGEAARWVTLHGACCGCVRGAADVAGGGCCCGAPDAAAHAALRRLRLRSCRRGQCGWETASGAPMAARREAPACVPGKRPLLLEAGCAAGRVCGFGAFAKWSR